MAKTGTNGQTIAQYLVTAVPVARSDQCAGDVREAIGRRSYRDASHVYLLDDGGRLAGVVEIGDVLSARADTAVHSLARPGQAHVVSPGTDREDAASAAIHACISSLAVCDDDGRFIGAVPAAALLTILRDEHLEDLHQMAGILGKSAAARDALTAPPYRRALYRLPWLLLGMAGSALATGTMAGFEGVLAANIAVVFFVPAIVYLADAVGTQSEAVAVRSISLTGADLGPLATAEVLTGILIGATLGALAYPLVLLAFGSTALAATVGLSLAAASSVATTIGFTLPWLFARLGYDPANGAGPLGTVIQDLLSLVIYFAIASMLVL